MGADLYHDPVSVELPRWMWLHLIGHLSDWNAGDPSRLIVNALARATGLDQAIAGSIREERGHAS